jgi:hypothetical protein
MKRKTLKLSDGMVVPQRIGGFDAIVRIIAHLMRGTGHDMKRQDVCG